MKIEIDRASLDDVRKALSGISKSVPRVQVRALNKTLTGVKTDMSKEIRDDLNLKKKYVDNHIYVQKANVAAVSGRVDVRSRPVGLINFTGTRAVKKGVSAKVKKSGARKIIAYAFIAYAKGASNVFQRIKGRGTGTPDRGRREGFFASLGKGHPMKYKIKRLTGPRLTDNLGKPGVFGALEKKAGDRLLINTEQEISYELSKL